MLNLATAGSPGKIDLVRQHGINHVFSTDDPDLVSKVRTITGGRGVDVVYEVVGQATFNKSVAALRHGGDLIHLGNSSGSPSVDEGSLSARSISYAQPSTGQYVKDRATLEAASSDLISAFQSGVFGKLAISRYALSDVARAHEDIAGRHVRGSAILIP